MPKRSPIRDTLLTAEELNEREVIACARIPRSWRRRLGLSQKTITHLILKAFADELKRLEREQARRQAPAAAILKDAA